MWTSIFILVHSSKVIFLLNRELSLTIEKTACHVKNTSLNKQNMPSGLVAGVGGGRREWLIS